MDVIQARQIRKADKKSTKHETGTFQRVAHCRRAGACLIVTPSIGAKTAVCGGIKFMLLDSHVFDAISIRLRMEFVSNLHAIN
jgi:hypothetical protein